MTNTKLVHKRTIAAAIVNDEGDLLPYSCQSSLDRCEEWAIKNLANWSKMQELGAKIVQVEITFLKEVMWRIK